MGPWVLLRGSLGARGRRVFGLSCSVPMGLCRRGNVQEWGDKQVHKTGLEQGSQLLGRDLPAIMELFQAFFLVRHCHAACFVSMLDLRGESAEAGKSLVTCFWECPAPADLIRKRTRSCQVRLTHRDLGDLWHFIGVQ